MQRTIQGKSVMCYLHACVCKAREREMCFMIQLTAASSPFKQGAAKSGHSNWRDTLRHVETRWVRRVETRWDTFFLPVAVLRLSSFLQSMGIDTEDVMTLFQALLQQVRQKRAEKALNDIERMKMLISFDFLIIFGHWKRHAEHIGTYWHHCAGSNPGLKTFA